MWDDFIGFFHTKCKSGYKFLQQQISFFKQIFQIGRQKLAIFLCSVRCWASHPAVSLRGQQTGKVLNLSIFSSFYFRLEEAPHVGHDVLVRFDPSTPFQSAKIPSRSIFRLKYFELIRSIHFHLTRLFRFFGENISRVPVTYCSSLSLTTGICGGWSIPVRKSLTGRSGSVPHISPSSPTGGT